MHDLHQVAVRYGRRGQSRPPNDPAIEFDNYCRRIEAEPAEQLFDGVRTIDRARIAIDR
jgi:hypothetical protein